jgi:hypothetical protein
MASIRDGRLAGVLSLLTCNYKKRGTLKYWETTFALRHPFSLIIRDAFLTVRCVVAPRR